MLKIEFQIKRAQLTERMHAQLMRKINRRVMERQLAERVPKHFEMTAYSEYGARQRSEKYNHYKMMKRNVGHIKPNVRTGQLKRSLRGKITATQYGSKLMLRATLEKFTKEDFELMSERERNGVRNQRRRLADWQKKEIAVISRAEIAYERKRQASEYKHGALSPEYKRKRTKRIK